MTDQNSERRASDQEFAEFPYPRSERDATPSVASVPPGTPYHHLARVRPRNWGRFLLGTLLIVALCIGAINLIEMGALLVQTALGGPSSPGPGGATLQNSVAEFALSSAILGVFLPIVLLAVWAVQRRPIGSVSSVIGRVRWRWLLSCCGVALVAIMVQNVLSGVLNTVVPSSAVQNAAEPQWVGWGAFLPTAAIVVLVTVFQASAEEYVFRGWLLQGIAGCFPRARDGVVGRTAAAVFGTPWPAILISAAAFASIHGYTGLGMLDIFLFGAVLGWLTVRTGGLEAGIAFHVIFNINAFLFMAAFGQMGAADDQGGVPWQDFVTFCVPLALFAGMTVRRARRRGLRTVTGTATAEDRTPVGVAAEAG
ncbi:CPBP family intramembrane metalloprotease [Actinomadura vinacea]|uniref:CPBP family intramembrane metalloprotease n=1 Tax=Actinomadura vinacea TaxID=115336 RepID=A0ABN3IHK5_9ACTN